MEAAAPEPKSSRWRWIALGILVSLLLLATLAFIPHVELLVLHFFRNTLNA